MLDAVDYTSKNNLDTGVAEAVIRETIEHELQAGVNINAQSGEYRNTALHQACWRREEVWARLLLEYKADPGLENNKHETALICYHLNKPTKDSQPILDLLKSHAAGSGGVAQAGRMEPGRHRCTGPSL